MNQEERNYKIMKKQKYDKDLDEASKEVSKRTFLMGVCAIATAFSFSLPTTMPISEIRYFLSGPIFLGFTVSNLKGMLTSINEKTMLKIKIEDIQDELNLDVLVEEESRKKL